MASPVEVLQGTMTTGVTTTPVTIATALVPDDLVLLVTSRGSAGGTVVTPSGLGTWQSVVSTSSSGYKIDSLTGVTGGGNISLTRSTTSSANEYVVLVVRGLDVPVVDAIARDSATSSSTSSLVLQALARGNNVAVSVLTCLANPVNPAAGSDPAAGWTTHRNTATLSAASVDITTGQTVTAVTSFFASSIDAQAALLILGTPLEAREYSVNAEALSTGTSADRALHAGSLEALTGDSDPASALTAASLEVLRRDTAVSPYIAAATVEVIASMNPKRDVNAASLEALTNAAAGTTAAAVEAAGLEVLAQAPPTPTVYAVTVDALSTVTPPPANAAVYAASVDALTPIRDTRAESVYLEVLHSAVPSAATQFAGWGIPI